MDAGVLHRTIPYCTKTLLEEAADAEDMAELFIAKAAMGCPWDPSPQRSNGDGMIDALQSCYLLRGHQTLLHLQSIAVIECDLHSVFHEFRLHLIARISPEDWCVCGLTCNTITVYISISILST